MQDLEDQRISDKHFRIRKSHDLKYPANKERCLITCGHLHDHVTNSLGLPITLEHRCFLKIGHGNFCQFSSACGELEVKAFVPESSLADDGFLILKTVA